MNGYLMVVIISILLGFVQDSDSASRADSSLSSILDDLDSNSDNRIRPGYREGPLEVHAFAFVRNIVEINEARSTISLTLLLMQMWTDGRLAFSDKHVSEILIDNADFMLRFWSPDTFIVNEVTPTTCGGGGATNTPIQVVHLSQDGKVLKTSRLGVTVLCPLDLQNYPFSRFHCNIELESFGHKTEDMVYFWRNGSKSVDYSSARAGLVGRTYSLLRAETHSQQSYIQTGGSYSKLIIRLEFAKVWLRHAIAYFIPTVALTVVSLMCMWIISEEHALSGIVLNFILAGMVVLVGSWEYSAIPQIPVLTPVDIHLGICLATISFTIAFHGLLFSLRRINKDHGQQGLHSRRDAYGSVVDGSKKGKEKTRSRMYGDPTGCASPTPNNDQEEQAEEGENNRLYYCSEGKDNDDVMSGDGTIERCYSPAKTKIVFLSRSLRTLLSFSKGVLLIAFLGAEAFFWYSYLK